MIMLDLVAVVSLQLYVDILLYFTTVRLHFPHYILFLFMDFLQHCIAYVLSLLVVIYFQSFYDRFLVQIRAECTSASYMCS